MRFSLRSATTRDRARHSYARTSRRQAKFTLKSVWINQKHLLRNDAALSEMPTILLVACR
jgi:hypothetical protein